MEKLLRRQHTQLRASVWTRQPTCAVPLQKTGERGKPSAAKGGSRAGGETARRDGFDVGAHVWGGVEQVEKLRASQRQEHAVRPRPQRGRARHLSEEGDLAEEIALAEHRDDPLVAAWISLPHLDPATHDDIEPVAWLALLEERPAGRMVLGSATPAPAVRRSE